MKKALFLVVLLALLLSLLPASVASACGDCDCPPPPPPPPPYDGCTPGYWKQPHHVGSWVGYAPGSASPFWPEHTMLEALKARNKQVGSGWLAAWYRHATAALLNMNNPDVNYPLTTINAIKDASKRDLEGFNEAGCPLN